MNAHKGDLIYWYESSVEDSSGKDKRGFSTDIQDISIQRYKQILLNKVKDILELADIICIFDQTCLLNSFMR